LEKINEKELKEEVLAHLEGIMDAVARLTSGNFMHNKSSIKLSAKIIINRLKELWDETEWSYKESKGFSKRK